MSLSRPMRVSEIADALGVSICTVWRWLKSNRFPNAFRTHGGHWRVPREDVEKMRAGV